MTSTFKNLKYCFVQDSCINLRAEKWRTTWKLQGHFRQTECNQLKWDLARTLELIKKLLCGDWVTRRSDDPGYVTVEWGQGKAEHWSPALCRKTGSELTHRRKGSVWFMLKYGRCDMRSCFWTVVRMMLFLSASSAPVKEGNPQWSRGFPVDEVHAWKWEYLHFSLLLGLGEKRQLNLVIYFACPENRITALPY